MKVIGNTNNSGEYIAIVSHTELEKLTDKYYGNLPKLKIGDEVNLGAGYDFRSDIEGACRQMSDAMKAFEKARESLLKFAVMVNELPKASGAQP